MSALKRYLIGGRDNRCKFVSNFDLIFCFCFKAREQKMRPYAIKIIFYANCCNVAG